MRRVFQAYTLTEILLVIVIIALLSIMSVTIYLKRADNAKLERAAAELEILNQAASNYFIQTNQWPASDGESTTITDDFAAFIPLKVETNKTILNPWGYPYTFNGYMWFSNDPVNESKYKQKFYVKTTLPNPTLADRLANMLPFTSYNQDPNDPQSVALYSSLPGISPLQNVEALSLIKSISTLELSKKTEESIDCAANRKPGLIAGLSGFTVSVYDGTQGDKQLLLIEQLNLNISPTSSSNVLEINPVYIGGFYDRSRNYQSSGAISEPIKVSAITFCNNP